MAQNQDSTKESRLEEWSLEQLRKQWEAVKTRARFSQRAFQQRVKHLQVETGKSSTCTEKAISRERKIINTDVAAGMASVRVRRQNREAHRKTAGRPKRSGEFSPPLFHVPDIELMGIKLKTKQTKNITHKKHYLLLGKNWEFEDLKRFPPQNKTARN